MGDKRKDEEAAANFIASKTDLPILSDSEKNAHVNVTQGTKILSRRLQSTASNHPELTNRYVDQEDFDGKAHIAYVKDEDGLGPSSRHKTMTDVDVNIFKIAVKLTETQKHAFISYISIGLGLEMACIQCGVTMRNLRTTMREDQDFREQVRLHDAAIDGQCQAVIFEAATNGSTKDAAILLGLRQKFKSEKASLRIARKSLEAKEKALNHVVSQSAATVNFKVLDNSELERYSLLCSRLQAGSQFTTDEKIEYADLCAKLASPVSGSSTIDVTRNVDKVFEDWDEE